MKTIVDLPQVERCVLVELRSRIQLEFPDWAFDMTLFGSRARGDAEPDSDMDVLLDVGVERLSFGQRQALRRIAGELSMRAGIVLSILVTDRYLRRARGDYSTFQNIRAEGIPV